MTVIRVAQEVIEVLANYDPKVRVAQEIIEVLANYDPNIEAAQVVIEVLMSTTAVTEDSLTIACQANIAVQDAFLYTRTLQIDATAAFAASEILAKYDTLTIAGTADISLSEYVAQPGDLTLSVISDISLSVANAIPGSITIGALCSFDSPGGVVYFNQRSIEGICDISVLDGFSYERTLQVDGTAAVAVDYIYIMEHYLTLDAIADLTCDSQYGVNATLTIAGTADIDLDPTGIWYESLGINGTCTIFIENVYDLLYVTAVIAGFDCSVTKTAPGDQNPGAVGSFSASALCVFNRPLTQTLVMLQTVVLKKPTWFVQQSLSLTQSVVVQKIHTEELVHTLSMTHEAVAVRSILQSLTLSDTATAQKVLTRSVTQTLALTDSVARNTVVNQSLSDTLVFNPPNLERLPIFGSQNQTGNRQSEYYVPNVYAILVPRQCLIILGVPAQTVVLPCPIWGDGQAYQGEINLKRSMTGIRYTYVKKTKTQKLNYSFELWTYKYLELRQFFIDHSEEVMTLQNHNSETWLVHLVNNPLEFTNESRWQPKGEKYNVTLEFEGVKLSG